MAAQEFDMTRRLAAEGIGAALLLATVVGSGIMAERLAGGNLAIALLGNTIPTGAILVVLITVFGPVSGAHFNPAVTFVFWLRREIRSGQAGAYFLVQALGAVAGMLAAHFMFELPLWQSSGHLRTGPAQWFSEGLATFGLVAAILGASRFRAEMVPWTVGLFITSAYWFTASTSFANPAVTIARAFTDTFSGILPAHAPAFIVAQFVGAAVAAALFGWMLDPARVRAPSPSDPAE